MSMDKKQESRIKMAKAVSGIFSGFEEIVNKTPGLNAAHIELDHLIGETERHSQAQKNVGTELTQKKNELRGALEERTIRICAALAAYATASTDPELKSFKMKYEISDTEVSRKRDMQLFTFAYLVYSDAHLHETLLEPFASADEVAELKELADDFNAALPMKRTQLSKSSLSTQNLEEAIGKIDLLFNETTDVLVKPWERKASDFFRSYKNARLVVEAATRKTKKTDEKSAVKQEK